MEDQNVVEEIYETNVAEPANEASVEDSQVNPILPEEEDKEMENAMQDEVGISESEEDEVKSPEDIPESEIEGAEDAKESLSAAEYNDWLSMQRKIHFSRRYRFDRASNQRRKEMYSSEQHIIAPEGENVSKLTESAKLKEDKIELIASANSGKILEGKMVGYRPVDSNDSNSRRLLAEIEFGNGKFSVLIPDYKFINFKYAENLTMDMQAQIEERMRKMIGANVKFVARYVNEKEMFAYGDRLKAMENESWGNYIRETRTGRPRVNVGDKITAQIIAVGNGYIIVNALGADVRITRNELAHDALSVSDYRDVYKKNQTILCKVLDIKHGEVTKFGGEKYTIVRPTLSVKACVKNPVEEYWDEFREGGIYMATVTNVNEIGVFVALKKKVTCLAAFPSYGNTPYVGQERTVRVTKKEIMEDGTKRISGVLIAE